MKKQIRARNPPKPMSNEVKDQNLRTLRSCRSYARSSCVLRPLWRQTKARVLRQQQEKEGFIVLGPKQYAESGLELKPASPVLLTPEELSKAKEMQRKAPLTYGTPERPRRPDFLQWRNKGFLLRGFEV